MDKKKVLFVVHQLNNGGVQKSAILFLNSIDFDKFDVTLYVRKDRLDLLPEVNKNVKIIVNYDKTHYYLKPYSLFTLLRIKMQALLKNKAKEEKLRAKISEYVANQKIIREKRKFFSGKEVYDVAVSYIQGYTAKLVSEIKAEKKITFYHGSTDETHAVHEEIFDKFDNIVGVSEGVSEVLKVLYPKWQDKITHLDNFVDCDEVVKKSKEYETDIKKDKTVLCTVGRMTAVKGYDLAVNSAKILKDNGEEFVWYFVGDGPERRRVENMIDEYGLSDNIRLVGMQKNPYPWMRSSDIYVQPSYEEACPLAITEAKTLLKPVISTATVGGKGLITDGIDGIITEISAKGLAEGVKKMLSDDTLRSDIIKNLEKKDFSEDKKRYVKQINLLLG